MSRLTELLKKPPGAPRPATPPSRPAAPNASGSMPRNARERSNPPAASPCWSDLPQPEDKRMQYSFCECAKGPLLIAIDGAGLRHVEFVQGGARPAATGWQRDDAALAPFVEQFVDYFAGRLRRFDLPWPPRAHHSSRPCGGRCATFLRRDRQLPPDCRGHRQPQGRAGGRRRQRPQSLSIIVPCHRVIGRSGELTGYGEASPSSAGCWHWSRRAQTTSR